MVFNSMVIIRKISLGGLISSLSIHGDSPKQNDRRVVKDGIF